ncbi:hypothetical protein V6x_07260 [Gimesia chilikensis]|uniref:Uncharacterized protein n=1 Tax=Gimesia chilikensis TaxID=2605989 RepID=A0A517W708_9PLAN|nr:hypothetical protein [Gimesia chilikensis]QDU01048.1 hypothetical protein V6x_07260 [Gimesia chilikensis]
MQTFQNSIHLMSFAVGTAVMFLVYLLLVCLHSELDLFQVATLLAVTLAVICPGLGLELIRRKFSPDMQASLTWRETLITVCSMGLGALGLSYFMFIAGVGMVIMSRLFGRLLSLLPIHNTLVLTSIVAGFTAYVTLLSSLTLVLNFLCRSKRGRPLNSSSLSAN